MKKVLFALLATLAVNAAAFDFDRAELQLWDTPETQVGYGLAGDYENNRKYIHADYIAWTPELEVPVAWTERGRKLQEAEFAQNRWVAYDLIPVTVQVHGDKRQVAAAGHLQLSGGVGGRRC